MDALPIPSGVAVRRAAARVVVAICWSVPIAAVAADAPAAATGGTTPAFKPGEIVIGEPIALPFGGAATRGGGGAAPADDPRSAVPPAAVAAAVPGSGWLGLAVAESTVPGRWRVEEVTSGGPADRAGIAAGDELRAVNGSSLASAEQVSQALTAIAAGQDVRIAVARADRLSEVVLRAEPRPTPRVTEPSPQPRAPSAFLPPPAATAATATAPVATPPAETAAAPGWQSSARRDDPAAASRFGSGTAADPVASVIAPAPFPAPPTAAPTLGDPPAAGRTALGVRTVPIDPATQARFRLPEPTGAYVIGVVQELPAARAGVPPGSVIVAVGDRPVRSPQELTRLVEHGPLNKPVPVQFVLPGGESKRANVVLQPLDAAIERAFIGGPTPVAAPPQLRPGPEPRRVERPTRDEGAIRDEIRTIRTRLDVLERLLDPLSRRSR